MSNISKALFVAVLSMLSGQAFADWQTDCAAVDQRVQTGTCAAINSAKAGIDKYQPPAACADKDQGVTFDVSSGSPAVLNPSDGSCSGSGGGGGVSGGGGSTDVLQGGGSTW